MTNNSPEAFDWIFSHFLDADIDVSANNFHRPRLNFPCNRMEDSSRRSQTKRNPLIMETRSFRRITFANAPSRSSSDATRRFSSIPLFSRHSSVKLSMNNGRTYCRCKPTVYLIDRKHLCQTNNH